MATVQFQKESPYKSKQRQPDKTDYRHARHMELSEVDGTHSVNADSKCNILNVALFGMGRAGLIHLKNILSNPNIHLKYVVEADMEKAANLLKLSNLPISALLAPDNIESILSDESIDGVIIATPTVTHENFIIKCLQAGKAVLCEKPIGLDLEGTKKCYDCAKKMGLPLLCAFNRRFDPNYREVFRQVRSGKVGRVHMIKAIARDSPLPPISYLKISGGIFHDCAVHDIDVICNILGEYPDKVFAAAATFIPEIKELNDHDTVAITLQFPSGTIGTIDLSRAAVYGYDQRIEVFGSEGMIQSDNETPIQTSFSGIAGATKPPICFSFPSRYFESYNMELRHFYNLIKGNEKLEVTFEEVFNISKIAFALEDSLKAEKFINVNYNY